MRSVHNISLLQFVVCIITCRDLKGSSRIISNYKINKNELFILNCKTVGEQLQ